MSGKFPRDYKPVGAQIPKKCFQPENLPKVFDFLDRIKPLAEKYSCTVADINMNMAWILAQDEKVILLSGSTTAEQIRENVRSAEIELSPGDVSLIRDMAEELG